MTKPPRVHMDSLRGPAQGRRLRCLLSSSRSSNAERNLFRLAGAAHDLFHQKAKINAPLHSRACGRAGTCRARRIPRMRWRIAVIRVDEGNVAMGADAGFDFGDSAIHRREQLHVIVDASWADVELPSSARRNARPPLLAHRPRSVREHERRGQFVHHVARMSGQHCRPQVKLEKPPK